MKLQKKAIMGVFAVLAVLGLVFTGCDNGNGTTVYTVTFYADGGIPAPASPVTVDPGSTITQPSTMTKTWYSFDGWYTDPARTAHAVFPITVNGNTSLYAKWKLNTFTNLIDVGLFLALLPVNTASNPASLTLNVGLGDMMQEDSGWRQLLHVLNIAEKYVELDLSTCTMNGTEFNPDSSITNGKNRIVSIVLPATATSIAGGTGYLLHNSPNYTIPTFNSFHNLKSINGTNVATIGDYIFNSPYGNQFVLQSVNFPQATSIGTRAFHNCRGLQYVSFPQVANIGDYAFAGCHSLRSANFPQVTSIGVCTFIYCVNLQNTNFPKIADIDEEAFYSCTSLQDVNFPQVKSIGAGAFRDCTSLQTLNIPQVVSIGDRVFLNTGNAVLTMSMGSAAPTLGYSMFDVTKTVIVKVPAGATGYSPAPSPFSGSPITINSGTDTNWANGFRGGGWDGTTWASGGGTTYIYQSISVIIQQQ
jgi:uncharacterized repeat protein (TIGR02543 family)